VVRKINVKIIFRIFAFYTRFHFSHRNFAESNSHFICGSVLHFRIFAFYAKEVLLSKQVNYNQVVVK